jgi:hypothetical protein
MALTGKCHLLKTLMATREANAGSLALTGQPEWEESDIGHFNLQKNETLSCKQIENARPR